MGKDREQYRKLTREELEQIAGEELPERAAMSLINANVAAPINVALAARVLSDKSISYANAQRDVDITTAPAPKAPAASRRGAEPLDPPGATPNP